MLLKLCSDGKQKRVSGFMFLALFLAMRVEGLVAKNLSPKLGRQGSNSAMSLRLQTSAFPSVPQLPHP